jgi:hypothetical protein
MPLFGKKTGFRPRMMDKNQGDMQLKRNTTWTKTIEKMQQRTKN